MSKELEAYKRLRNNIRLLEENTSLKYFFENDEFHFGEDLDIIEPALKNDDKDKFELIEQIRKLKDEVASLNSFNSKLWVEREYNEKKLKALEIIKEKKVDVGILWHYDFNYYDYNFIVAEDRRKLTEEEIDLLKEVLL